MYMKVFVEIETSKYLCAFIFISFLFQHLRLCIVLQIKPIYIITIKKHNNITNYSIFLIDRQLRKHIDNFSRIETRLWSENERQLAL